MFMFLNVEISLESTVSHPKTNPSVAKVVLNYYLVIVCRRKQVLLSGNCIYYKVISMIFRTLYYNKKTAVWKTIFLLTNCHHRLLRKTASEAFHCDICVTDL